jgi:hypothetical protein
MSFPAYKPPAPPTAATSTVPPASRDDPKLPDTPATYDVNELRSAVGVSPLPGSTTEKHRAASSEDNEEDDDDHAPRRRRNPRTILVSGAAIAVVLGVAALVIVGTLNSDRYVLACEAERAVPEQGRGFPPWGTRAMTGEQWRPLKIAAATRCQPQETDDPLVLERAYLAMVLEQATALLTAREVTKVDDAETLLEQALLLTRPPEHEAEPLAKQRSEHHQDVERMLGDVTYWRAAAKLRDAGAALGDAAKQFDAAVAQHPRHVSDAAAWAAYARRLAQELRTGPGAAAAASAGSAAPASGPPPPPAPATPDHPGVPAGSALPVEPEASTAPPAAAPPPDAGAPTGGVLL